MVQNIHIPIQIPTSFSHRTLNKTKSKNSSDFHFLSAPSTGIKLTQCCQFKSHQFLSNIPLSFLYRSLGRPFLVYVSKGNEFQTIQKPWTLSMHLIHLKWSNFGWSGVRVYLVFGYRKYQGYKTQRKDVKHE